MCPYKLTVSSHMRCRETKVSLENILNCLSCFCFLTTCKFQSFRHQQEKKSIKGVQSLLVSCFHAHFLFLFMSFSSFWELRFNTSLRTKHEHVWNWKSYFSSFFNSFCLHFNFIRATWLLLPQSYSYSNMFSFFII